MGYLRALRLHKFTVDFEESHATYYTPTGEENNFDSENYPFESITIVMIVPESEG